MPITSNMHADVACLSPIACGDSCTSVVKQPRKVLGTRCDERFQAASGDTDTMRSFLGQQDYLGIVHYVIACLDVMNT